MTALLVFEKGSYFVVGDRTRVVDVEVGEGLLEMFGRKGIRLQSGYYKLCEVDLPWAVSVDYPHQKLYPIVAELFLVKKGLFELLGWNDSIMIMIQVLENMFQNAFFFWRQNLWHNVSIHNSFQLILKLNMTKDTLNVDIFYKVWVLDFTPNDVFSTYFWIQSCLYAS